MAAWWWVQLRVASGSFSSTSTPELERHMDKVAPPSWVPPLPFEARILDAVPFSHFNVVSCCWRCSSVSNGSVLQAQEAQAPPSLWAVMRCLRAPQVLDWNDFDVFSVARLSRGRPLQTVTWALLQHFDLIESLSLPPDQLRRFLKVRPCKQSS